MRTTPILSFALLAAAALPAAPAQAGVVSPKGVRFADVAVNAGGATVVAWERATVSAFGVQARTGASPSKLGRTQRLAERGYSPRVAIGADGTRAVMWLERALRGGVRSVRVAVARPGHGFGKRQLVDSRHANMGVVDVAVQPDGRVVAVWGRSSTTLGYALAARGHAFAKARNLTTTGQSSLSTIALDPRDGAVVLAYGTPPSVAPPANQQSAVRTLASSAAAFSAPLVVSDPAGLSESRPAAAGGAGSGVSFTQTGGAGTSLRLARRTGDGTWAASELVAAPGYGPDVYAVGLQATLPADGSALATWSISTEPGGRGSISRQTVVSIAPPRGAFGLPAALTPANGTYGATAVAAAGAEAFVATATAHGPVLLATKAVGAATLGAPATLTTRGDGDVLLAAGGSHVLAAWQRNDRLVVHTVR